MTRNTLQPFCSTYPPTSTPAPSLVESYPRILISQYRKSMCRKETELLNSKSCPCGLKRFPRNLPSFIMSSDNRGQRSLNDLELVIRISALRGLWTLNLNRFPCTSFPLCHTAISVPKILAFTEWLAIPRVTNSVACCLLLAIAMTSSSIPKVSYHNFWGERSFPHYS